MNFEYDDFARPISRHTHIQLQDLLDKVNKSFKRLSSPWILHPKPKGLTTSILTKNLLTQQEIYLIQHCSVDEAYSYISGYNDALIHLQIDGVNIKFHPPIVVPTIIKRKKILGLF